MKTRNGFVSNSSSSSFIIAIGEVKIQNVEPLRQIIKKHGVDSEVIKVRALKEFGKDFKSHVCESDGKSVEVESFNYNCVSTDIQDKNDEDFIFAYYEFGNHGDEDFSIYDEDGEFCEYDYDIDWDDFNGMRCRQALDEICNSGLVENIQMSYGAGRNG